jgi:hypothetical protein
MENQSYPRDPLIKFRMFQALKMMISGMDYNIPNKIPIPKNDETKKGKRGVKALFCRRLSAD